jgi:hypothetical protein
VPQDWAELDPVTAAAPVKVGIETDRGPWVAALVAAGDEVFAINPMSVSRYRDDHIVARNQAYNGRSMSRFADPRGVPGHHRRGRTTAGERPLTA